MSVNNINLAKGHEVRSTLSGKRVGFIGGGNMARALIGGLLKANTCQPRDLHVAHPSANERKQFAHLLGDNEHADNELVVRGCDVIVLCVKPQVLEKVCKHIRGFIEPSRHLIVSVCAGISLAKLSTYLSMASATSGEMSINACDSKLRIVRCTLNTAALIGHSCSVYSQNGSLYASDKQLVEELLSSVGVCMGELSDSDMDAAMAACACGIAYMYMMVW
jgi:pyrroline-5-carboxylate reductase